MESIFDLLYRKLYVRPRFNRLERVAEYNHRQLIERLSKRNRKLVLRIIDAKDQICDDVSLDSFICGFRLAWQTANQIQNYDGCSDCSQRAEPDTRQLFSREVSK